MIEPTISSAIIHQRSDFMSAGRLSAVAVSVLIGRSFSSRNRAQKSVAPPALTIAARITFAPSFNVSRFETPSSITVWRSL